VAVPHDEQKNQRQDEPDAAENRAGTRNAQPQIARRCDLTAGQPSEPQRQDRSHERKRYEPENAEYKAGYGEWIEIGVPGRLLHPPATIPAPK
jgi:hypothetical protein